MKRWLRQIALSILLGAVTTVAVAWACGAFVRVSGIPPQQYAEGRTTPTLSGWFVRAYGKPGARCVLGWPLGEVVHRWPAGDWLDDQLVGEEINWPDAFLHPVEEDPNYFKMKVVNLRGWPKPALWCELLLDRSSPSSGLSRMPARVSGAIWWRRPPGSNIGSSVQQDVVTLPLRPVWSAFALDTAFYAAMWAGVLALRRRLRRAVVYLSRRVLRRGAVLSVVLGAVTTAGVAWFCALWVDEAYARDRGRDGYGQSTDGTNYQIWWVHRDSEPGAVRLRSHWIAPGRGFGVPGSPAVGPVEDFLPYWTDYLSPTADDASRVLDARGWPMLAMWGGFLRRTAPHRLDTRHPPGTHLAGLRGRHLVLCGHLGGTASSSRGAGRCPPHGACRPRPLRSLRLRPPPCRARGMPRVRKKLGTVTDFLTRMPPPGITDRKKIGNCP
jgi:hypothetical protein